MVDCATRLIVRRQFKTLMNVPYWTAPILQKQAHVKKVLKVLEILAAIYNSNKMVGSSWVWGRGHAPG